ncbi:MAG: transcriptional repressor [Erysipelotrichaceae bacterium]
MIRKQSKQRDLILNYVKSMDAHASAEEIFDGINQTDEKISLATIYRNLNILAEMDEIKKISHPIYGYVYDKTCEPHDHFYCTECKSFMDVNTKYHEELDNETQKETKLRIYSHSTLFEGICNTCLKKYSH